MFKKELNKTQKNKIDAFIDSLYFDVQGASGMGTKLSEEYVIKLLTRFIVSLGTAFWSISELLEYIRNRRNLKEFIK